MELLLLIITGIFRCNPPNNSNSQPYRFKLCNETVVPSHQSYLDEGIRKNIFCCFYRNDIGEIFSLSHLMLSHIYYPVESIIRTKFLTQEFANPSFLFNFGIHTKKL